MTTTSVKRTPRPWCAGILSAVAISACLTLCALPGSAQAQTMPTGAATPASPDSQTPVGGPIRLRQPAADPNNGTTTPQTTAAPATAPVVPLTPPKPGEFEAYVELPRFGADLVNELPTGAPEYNPEIPADYLIQSGDEILVSIWGTVDADLRLVVDRGGRVSIPRVGPVMVAGLRYDELQPALARRAAQVFKNFELSAALGRLRGVRIFVTGFAQRPGAYVVNGLSTVMNAVMRAGGPGVAGSFRQIELRRGGKAVATLDFYDLIVRGDRSGDRVVQPDDVVHVQPVGPQVALRGSANKQAVFELKTGETLQDLIQMAGGFNTVADRSRVALERLDARNTTRVVQLPLPDNNTMVLGNGDIVRIFSAVDTALSVERQNRRVKVEGEVASPGEYLLPPGSTLADAVRAAGGLTRSAYVYGAQFNRESVRLAQAENYDRALRDLETEFVRNAASRRVSTAEDGATQTSQSAATSRLIERMRALKPSGRVVLQIPPGSTSMPELLLEDQDRLLIPSRPTSIGVFGSVFNAGNYLFIEGRNLDDYLRLAGGPTKGADESSVFVVRASGQVVSSRQKSGFFDRGNQIAGLVAEPGDTVYVPEELDKSTFLQTARDWTLLLFQLGVGAAGIKSALN